MVMRWLLSLAFGFQVTVALASNDPVRDNWSQHIKNQEAYQMHTQRAAAEVRASISMTPEKKASVNQLLEKSGLLQDGSKVKIGASVTRPVDTAKVASTLVDRLKNAKDYAKHLGKASIPAFVGTAAFHGLMEGIDYVMDEGGNVTKKEDTTSSDGFVTKFDPYGYEHNGKLYQTGKNAFAAWAKSVKITGYTILSESLYTESSTSIYAKVVWREKDTTTNKIDYFRRVANPSYSPSEQPANVPVSDADLQTALKTALESNNPALATAIAEAMKAAYTQDNSEGQPKTTNPLVADAQNDMQRAVDGALDNPTSSSGTADRPEGYYKITDGDKTIEGYVKPSDTTSTGTTDSTTTTNPDGSTTTTGTTAQQWPGFCDWAGIVCDFIDWVKDDEQLKEDDPEDIDDSIFSRKFDFDFKMSANCPPNPIWNFKFLDQNWSKEIDITMICDFFKYLGYAIVFASNMTALWIVYGAVTVREQA